MMPFIIFTSSDIAQSANITRQVLSFYYGWYGNVAMSGRWVHWRDIDPGTEHIGDATDFPEYGAYDSHDPALIERQVVAARTAGITGFIASWWGQGGFEDKGVPLLLEAATALLR